MLRLCGKIRCVRAAVSHRHTKSLHGTNRNIGAQFTRRSQQSQREWISRHDHQRATGLDFCNRAAPIADTTIGRRIRKQRSTEFIFGKINFVGLTNHNGDTNAVSAGLNHADSLRMRCGVNEKFDATIFGHAKGHIHCFGCRGRFIKQTGASNF